MMNLGHRNLLPEVMDTLDDAEYFRCIADLARVNVVTITHRSSLAWLRRATAGLVKGDIFSVLDVACGHGDLLRGIHAWAEKHGLRARLEGIDLNPRSALVARAALPLGVDITFRTGNVFDFRPDPRPDFIVSSQFAHHLDDAAVVTFLHWLEKYAARGWYIADLHRHAIPYYGFAVLATLLRVHPVVRSDGRISIARAFTRADWRALLARARLDAEVQWHIPFRHGVGRLK